MDLIIRQARLRGRQGLWDIGINEERIAAVAEHLSKPAAAEIDASGLLVTPTYVNGHIHLDKCFLQETMRPNRDYTFGECLELTWEHKARYTTEEILARAGRAIQEGIANGTTVFRALVDVDKHRQAARTRACLQIRARA